MTKLTAKSMTSLLWDTMEKLSEENMDPCRADAIAVQAREILRTKNTQLRISQQAKRDVPLSVIEFSEGK